MISWNECFYECVIIMAALKVMSLNIRGLRQKGKRRTLFHRLKQRECSVVALQESYITIKDVDTWQREWGGKLYATPGTEHSRGNILVSKNFVGTQLSYVEHSDRIQGLRFEIEK